MPLVSLGLPVYNGEKYIKKSIDTVLAQTFTDFELIITDNASTDSTQAICEEYAKKDSRVRYVRNENNIGAAPNFNLCFELSTGKYFKWTTDDDFIAREYLEKCVEILEEDPEIIIAYSKAVFVDKDGNPEEFYDLKLDTDSDVLPKRFSDVILIGHHCFEVFGLIRRDALEKTAVMGNYSHGDGVLLAHLAMFGRFEEIPEYLFYSRRHDDHSSSIYGVYRDQIDYYGWAEWFDPKNKGKMILPYTKILSELFRIINEVPLTFSQTIDCYKSLGKWYKARWKTIGGEWKRFVKYYLEKTNIISF